MNVSPPSSQKRALPYWIQEYISEEERESLPAGRIADAVANLGDIAGADATAAETRGRSRLSWLRLIALTFLLPGLGGLIFSAMISTTYREKLPRTPVAAMGRTIPRNVHGVTVFQTAKEDTQLSAMEYGSVSVFLVGLLVGIVYLEKWSTARQQELETNVLGEGEYEV